MPNLQALAAVPSFSSQLGQALGSGASTGISAALSQMLKQKQENQQQMGNYSNILNEMEGLLDTGQAGRVASLKSYLFPSLQESTARFQSLGTSLLGLAQQVALKQGIRNQREFESFMKRTIPNEFDTVQTARGKINALRQYIGTGRFPPTSTKSKIEPSSSSVRMRDPSGALREVSRDQAIEAQKHGYTLVK